MGSSIKDFLPPRKGGRFKQGWYHPQNPSKYIGDIEKIIWRSSWEKRFCYWLDMTPDIIEWSSEPASIQYRYQMDGKIHRYFIDFYFKVRRGDTVEKYLVEVKPKSQLSAPSVPRNKTEKSMRNYAYRLKQYTTNYDKYQAILAWCSQNNYKFAYLTEDSKLF